MCWGLAGQLPARVLLLPQGLLLLQGLQGL
jgi:hypothetical protein